MDTLKKIGSILLIGLAVVILAVRLIPRDRVKPFKEFRSVEGRFTVLMPGEPKRSSQTRQTPFGPATNLKYTGGNDRAVFMISCVDYPPKIAEAGDMMQMIDKAKAQVIAARKGTLVSDSPYNFHGYTGKEMIIEDSQGYTVRMRLFFIGTQLYQLTVGGKSDKILYEKGDEFMDSFTVDGVS